MPATVVIELVGYRGWTESIGDDREWVIQSTQSQISKALHSIVKDWEGAALPLRYDYEIVILPYWTNLGKFGRELVKRLENVVPTPLRLKYCCGPIPDSLDNCAEEVPPDRCRADEVAVAHADINFFTEITTYKGFYGAYVTALKLVANTASMLVNDAIVQYLGGDNLAAITSPHKLGKVLDVILSFKGVKVGVGISSSPRKAFEAAARSLREIREGGRRERVRITRV